MRLIVQDRQKFSLFTRGKKKIHLLFACFCLIFHNVAAIYFHKVERFSEGFELDPPIFGRSKVQVPLEFGTSPKCSHLFLSSLPTENVIKLRS